MTEDPSYPYCQAEGGPPRIDINLYTIGGWFSQGFPTQGTNAVAFGGYIKAATDPKDSWIEGMVIDSFGSAVITGIMTEVSLTFSKQYFRTQVNVPPIQYDLKKKKDGKWHGHYKVSGYPTPADNRVVCEMYLIVQNAFGILTGKLGGSNFDPTKVEGLT